MGDIDKVGIDDFKPYGYMTTAFRIDAKPNRAPVSWNWKQDYGDWILERANAIGDALWPCWDATASPPRWAGDARDTAINLTLADLRLMAGPLDGMRRDPGRPPEDGSNHGRWFEQEDDLFNYGWPRRFEVAFRNSAADPTIMADSLVDGDGRYAGSISLLLKQHLHRPRAHQAAFWLGEPAPDQMAAWSGWSSSAISGHSFQGLMACLACYLDQHDAWTNGDILQLHGLAADIGDRRVFAGVHYPSDNIMSWWVAFEAIKHLAVSDAQYQLMKEFVSGTVMQSTVFREMVSFGQHAKCVEIMRDCIK